MKERVTLSVVECGKVLLGGEFEYDPDVRADVERFVEEYKQIAATVLEQQKIHGVKVELKVKCSADLHAQVQALAGSGVWKIEGATSVSEVRTGTMPLAEHVKKAPTVKRVVGE